MINIGQINTILGFVQHFEFYGTISVLFTGSLFIEFLICTLFDTTMVSISRKWRNDVFVADCRLADAFICQWVYNDLVGLVDSKNDWAKYRDANHFLY